jgi:hypothetical protein
MVLLVNFTYDLLPKNVFWKFPHTDIYQAISWDRLHAYHGGLFSDHIWEEVKSVAEELGKNVSKLIDTQYGFNLFVEIEFIYFYLQG